MRHNKRFDEEEDPTTRREFRASLGARNRRREGTKVKRMGSGKLSKPIRKPYARLVKVWLKEQE